MKKTVFTGAAVAIVTPFDKDNKINYKKLAELIDFQIENSTDAIVICGTSGEGPTLTHEEHAEAIRFTAEYVAGRVPATTQSMPLSSLTRRKKTALTRF